MSAFVTVMTVGAFAILVCMLISAVRDATNAEDKANFWKTECATRDGRIRELEGHLEEADEDDDCEGCDQRDEELKRLGVALREARESHANLTAANVKTQGRVMALEDDLRRIETALSERSRELQKVQSELDRLRSGCFTAKEFMDLWDKVEEKDKVLHAKAVEAGRRAYAEHRFGPLGQHLVSRLTPGEHCGIPAPGQMRRGGMGDFPNPLLGKAERSES